MKNESEDAKALQVNSDNDFAKEIRKVLILSSNQKLEKTDVDILLNGKLVQLNQGEDIDSRARQILRDSYIEWIKHQPNYNFVVLTGAGSSFGLGDGEYKGTGLAGLWDQISHEDADSLRTLIDVCMFPEESKDLEKLLTLSQRHYEIGKSPKIKESIDSVEELIFQMCSLKLTKPLVSPHYQFLDKVTRRKVSLPRVKVFTLNYDTLFEQAATEGRFTIIDGFTFTSSRIFNGQVYDYDIVLRAGSRLKNEDNFVKKVFHLYKLHGSIDWVSENGQILQCTKEGMEARLAANESSRRVMIFPRDSKFELSYEQPYFELIGRLQKTLRSENTFLITVGFSFNDKHIRSIILESLKQNPSLHLLVVSFPDIISDEELQAFAELDNRIMLIAETWESFAKHFPLNSSFSTNDPLELIVDLLAEKLNDKKSNANGAHQNI